MGQEDFFLLGTALLKNLLICLVQLEQPQI